MHRLETVVVKMKQPTKGKVNILEALAKSFAHGVQIGLDQAEALKTASRAKIHNAAYASIRANAELPSDYARMAVNQSVALARSFYGLRKSKHQKHTSFPKVNGSQGIGLGTNAFKLKQRAFGWILRVSLGTRGNYLWLPLSVCDKYTDKLQYVKGDARIFERDSKWYVMLPLRIPHTPTVRDGEPTFIGVDLGIVRLATISTPDKVLFFDGREARHKREHFSDLRRRYGKHKRLDKVKATKGKESRYMTDLNHKISKAIVELALQYDNPIICVERLDGIRDRVRASKKFNRMMSGWAFRQLTDFIKYKAACHDIEVVFVDPRNTSKTCCKCGHSSRSNRPTQSDFRCVACGYQTNADRNAAINIAAVGLNAYLQGATDMPRFNEPDELVVDNSPDVTFESQP